MLVIKEIEQSNSGTFMCEVFDPASDQTATTRLDIDVIGKFWHLKNKSIQRQIPYRMKIYAEFNLATWLRLVKFPEWISTVTTINYRFLKI